MAGPFLRASLFLILKTPTTAFFCFKESFFGLVESYFFPTQRFRKIYSKVPEVEKTPKT